MPDKRRRVGFSNEQLSIGDQSWSIADTCIRLGARGCILVRRSQRGLLGAYSYASLLSFKTGHRSINDWSYRQARHVPLSLCTIEAPIKAEWSMLPTFAWCFYTIVTTSSLRPIPEAGQALFPPLQILFTRTTFLGGKDIKHFQLAKRRWCMSGWG